uniref:Uncharacterized protein n=1 Tax=Clytia hemisphaerica TaxID=252671 RepID=A0A7M5XF15_9CNID|eukprot:TCONS_00004831-protein
MYIAESINEETCQQHLNVAKASPHHLSPRRCLKQDAMVSSRPRARSESLTSNRHKRSSSVDLKKHVNNNTKTNKPTSNTNLSPLTPASLLCYTVINRDEILLQKLLSQYQNKVNELSEEGLTPLHLASMDGNTDIMRILFQHGASLDKVDFNNRSALEYAVLSGQFDAAQFLIENGCDTSLIRDGYSF